MEGNKDHGSNELGPMMAPVMWVNHRAFLLQWCPKCCFLRSLRTYHVPWCNICVEEFDHHRKWVNNCIGHSNFRVFMLLVQSLCLYSDAMLVTCLILLVRTIHLPFTTDKIIVYQPGCGAPLGSARGQHPSGHTRRRLPAASLRAAANQGQVGERGPALPRGQVIQGLQFSYFGYLKATQVHYFGKSHYGLIRKNCKGEK
uniref:Palmitoyltransferase n=1 Tax=Equus caballus TaxID=9796 RepID=A0A9L0RL21_HORSE